MISNKTMTTLQLSENLYPIDEVFMTFTQCLIKRSTQHEMLFWLFEIIASAEDVLCGLLCIYLQFYSIGNKGLAKYVLRKSHKYKKDGNIKHLINMVNNMRLAKPTIDAYEVTQNSVIEVSPNKIYKSEPWVKCNPPYSFGLLKSIHANDRHNIGAYLNIMFKKHGFDETYNVITNYLVNVRGRKYDEMILTKENFPNEIFLLSAIISNANTIDNNSKAMRFVAVPQGDIDKMLNHFTKKADKYYLKLKERRLYSTHRKLGSGDYGRFHIEEGLEKASWYSWEYYCYNSTEWKKRFDKYSGKQNDETKKIVFLNDDCLEAFYDDGNAMEFDEQDCETQSKSLHEIYVYTDINKWFSDLINECLVQVMHNIKI